MKCRLVFNHFATSKVIKSLRYKELLRVKENEICFWREGTINTIIFKLLKIVVYCKQKLEECSTLEKCERRDFDNGLLVTSSYSKIKMI